MSFQVDTSDRFDRRAKKLKKRHRSLSSDIDRLITTLEEDPTHGTHIGGQQYKIRLAISSKGKGKSGGARVITAVYLAAENVVLLDIYDKADRATVSKEDIAAARAEHEADADDADEK